jgi:hypothetical protein
MECVDADFRGWSYASAGASSRSVIAATRFHHDLSLSSLRISNRSAIRGKAEVDEAHSKRR